MGVACVDHANEKNTVYTLMKQFDLPEEKFTAGRNDTVVVLDKRMPVKEGVLTYMSLPPKLIQTDADLIYSLVKSHHFQNVNLAFKDYVRERYRRLVHDDDEISQEILSLYQGSNCLNFCNKYDLRDSKGDMAVHLLGFHEDNAGDKFEIPTGMVSLLNPLAAHLIPGSLHLNTTVKRVRWHIAKDKAPPHCQVKCSDGRTFQAHHVIVAIPLGHLKEHAESMFFPGLPWEKMDSIKKMGFGVVARVYLLYETPFWTHPFSLIWPGTETVRKTLWLETLKFKSLHHHPQILEVNLQSSTAETMPDQNIQRQLTTILRFHYREDVPEPVKIFKTDWYSNSLFRGSHPYLTTQCSEKDLSQLAAPLVAENVPIILFAGDYTHSNYTCMLHAARASGLREAQRLHDLYNTLLAFENKNI